MAPSEAEAETDGEAEFARIDWDQQSRRRRPRRRTAVLLVGLLGLAASFAHDVLARPEEPVPFSLVGWDPTRIDWLLLVSLVVVLRYAVVPAAARPERSARRLRAVLRRPAGVVSLAVVVLAVLGATVGPLVVDSLFARLEHRLQPPVYTTVPADFVYAYECLGEVAGGHCRGTWRYPLGTNAIGEDMLELLVGGLRTALTLGFAAAVVMSVVGTVVGATAGYLGGRVDTVLMRYVDVQQTVPAVLVYVLVASLFLGEYGGIPDGGLFALALVFGLLDWGGIARLVRAEALTRRSTGYVRAAKVAGAGDLHVLRRHVLPNSTSTVLTAVTRRIPLLILAQVALGFLELNRVGPGAFGRVLRTGLTGDVAWHGKWWVTTTAVVALVALTLSFNVLGDVLRDVLDPRTSAERE